MYSVGFFQGAVIWAEVRPSTMGPPRGRCGIAVAAIPFPEGVNGKLDILAENGTGIDLSPHTLN